MKLYVTGIPEPAGYAAVRALREALDLFNPEHPSTNAGASRVLQDIEGQRSPYLLGESDDPEVIKAVRMKLTEANIMCAQDLPEDALAPEPEIPAVGDTVSYAACRFALAAMRLADGNPHLALNHCILLAHQIEETEENPGVFREAAAVLLDVFPSKIVIDADRIIARHVGLDPDNLPPETED
jgi:hypothetical protein